MTTEPKAVHSDPEILGGTPVFVGTRVPVKSLFDHLKAGDSLDVFLDSFPSVSRVQAVAALELARSTTEFYAAISTRRWISWRRPFVLCAGASILLIVVTQWVPGIPRAGVLALLDALMASTILFVASAFWEMWRAFARPNKPLQPTNDEKIKLE